MMIPKIATASVPWLTTDRMIEVDRVMMEGYRIDLVRMMENPGRNLAQLARERFLNGDPRGRIAVRRDRGQRWRGPRRRPQAPQLGS